MIGPPVLGRRSMRGTQRLRLGLFGPNCSSGTLHHARPGALVGQLGRQSADGAARRRGRDRLPLADRSLERLRRATAITPARRSRRSPGRPGCWRRRNASPCFGTVHVPLFHPLIAAKQMVTADHVGEGRFGLNIVCGWNEGEFAMFGLAQKDHGGRYAQGQEWIDVVTRAWSEDDFDFHGAYYRPARRSREAQTLRRDASADHERGTFRRRPRVRAAQLRRALHPARQRRLRCAPASRRRRRSSPAVKDEARAIGREIEVYTDGYACCRPTRAEAEEYLRYIIVEHADWKAVDNIMAMRGVGDDLSPEEFDSGAAPLRQQQRRLLAHREPGRRRRAAHAHRRDGVRRHRP